MNHSDSSSSMNRKHARMDIPLSWDTVPCNREVFPASVGGVPTCCGKGVPTVPDKMPLRRRAQGHSHSKYFRDVSLEQLCDAALALSLVFKLIEVLRDQIADGVPFDHEGKAVPLMRT